MFSFLKCVALLIILLLNSPVSAGSVKSNINPNDVTFNFSPSTDDFRFGQIISNVFSDLSKDKLDPKDYAELMKLFPRTKSFGNMAKTIDRIGEILTIKDQDSFYKNCAIRSKKNTEVTDSVEIRIELSLDTYCRNIYLKKLFQFSPYINLSSRDLNYFKESSLNFIRGENTSNLTELIKHYKVNVVEHEKISNLLIEKIIEFKTRPPSIILTNLKISPKFNQFLQSNINLDDSSTSYFQEEFQKTVREAQDAIERGDFNQAKQLSLGAVRFYNQNRLFISDKRAFVGIVLNAKAFYYKGKDKEALELFEHARSLAPKEEFSEANFYLLWPYIVEKDLKGLKKAISKYNLDKDFDKFDSKLQYWIAYSESRNGDLKKAQEFYNKIITSSPYSFYTIISLKELALNSKSGTTEEEILSKLISKGNPSDYSVDKFSDHLTDSLKRFTIWSKIGNERFQTLEIKFIQNLSKDKTFNDQDLIKNVTSQAHKEFITLNLVKLLNSKNRYVSAFKIFQDSVEQNSLTLNVKLIKQIFPLSYFDIIKKNALNIDPLIIISLIRQESAFNPEANSGVGAKGLMQLMPATARRFNKKIKISNLGNPEINVALGTKYLRVLISRYDGNLIYALASYNAGESRIDRWKKEIFKTDDPLATIESIPFEETRNYVKLIYRNYFFYNIIQNKSILKTPIEDSFKVTQVQSKI